jgi:hypothetical protein
LVQINGPVLLAAAADGEYFSERHPVIFHGRKELVQRRGPKPRGTVFYQRVAVGKHTIAGFELRQCLVEIKRFFINHLARIEVNDHRAQALGAGIQSEEKSSHGT